MGLLSRFENTMEDAVDGAAERLFDAPLSPVQIQKKAEKQMNRERIVGAGKQYAPTLYTVLVNYDDDARLFAYYPTLAGEVETYLSAKAAENGYVMDGAPLVRFIPADGLKSGKFDVVAEMVAAPIVDKLRDEEMERYGLADAGQPPYEPAYDECDEYGDAYGNAPAYEDGAYDDAYGSACDPYQQAETPYDNDDFDPYSQPQQGYADEYQDDYAPAPEYAPAAEAETYEDAYDESYQIHESAHPSLEFLPGFDKDVEEKVLRPTLRPEEMRAATLRPEEMNLGADEFVDEDESRYQDARPQARPQAEPRYEEPRYEEPRYEEPRYEEPRPQMDARPDFRANDEYRTPMAAPAQHTMLFQPNKQAAQRPQQRPQQGAEKHRYLEDTATGRRYILQGDHVLIGRDSACSVVVSDINASRRHAEMYLDSFGEWVINDIGSLNGTFVNGHEVQSLQLIDGDRISIGKKTLVYRKG